MITPIKNNPFFFLSKTHKIRAANNYQMLLILILFCISFTRVSPQDQDQLRVGFYSDTCPDAEDIVASTVREAASSDQSMPPALLRLHFHDCFVQGCDGSVLISDGEDPEKNATGHQGLKAFDVIDKAKSRLEGVCPGVVSCSDIVALAARDAVSLVNGPPYQVLTGRRDGTTSDISAAANMPEVQDSIEVLKAKFREKGLSERDLVVLSAAHTIGTTACFFMEKRLYEFSGTGGSDPNINPILLPELKNKCPKGGDINVRLEMDHGSGSRFDTQILRNIRNGFAVLQSDAILYQDPTTKAVVDSYFGLLAPIFGPDFESDFVNAMTKMGTIGVKTGADGTIRRVCSSLH